MSARPVAAALACLALVAGCGSTEPGVASAPGTSSPASPAPSTAQIWMTRSGLLHRVTRTVGGGPAARAALQALLAGPTDAERAAGVRTAIPRGARVLALTVTGHRATVNLSERFAWNAGDSRSTVLRLAQVVYTLTGLPGIHSVQIEISGRPLRDGHRRVDYRGLTGG
jgi:Sporulation and spore germination